MTQEEIELRLSQIETELTALRTSLPLTPEEVASIRQRLEEIVKAASEAQTKADSEALRAYQAKQQCEDHSTFIARKKGEIEADHSAILSLKSACEETNRALAASRLEADEALKTVGAAKENLLTAQAWLEQSRPQLAAQIQGVSNNSATSESLLQETRQSTNDSKQSSTEAAQFRQSAEVAHNRIKELQQEVEDLTKKAREAKTATEADRATASNLVAELTTITGELKTRHEEIESLRTNLKSLSEQYIELNKKVEGLLPHAASAGLASAFREQRARFKKPQRSWLIVFITSLVLLFLIALPNFYSELLGTSISAKDTSWDSILRQLVHRLPLVFPLVWLAIYSGRNYMLAVRMEEDYAYKEAVSTAFEGYKREMASIPLVGDVKEAPLNTLCGNILSAIAQRPGRIYEGKQQDITPLAPVVAATEALTNRSIPPPAA